MAIIPLSIVFYNNNRLSLKSAPILVKSLALLSTITLLNMGIYLTYNSTHKTILSYDYDIDDTFGILSVSNVLPLIGCISKSFDRV